MNVMFLGDNMGFDEAPPVPAPAPAENQPPTSGDSQTPAPTSPGRFDQILGVIRGGLDTYRASQGMNPYYQQMPQQMPRGGRLAPAGRGAAAADAAGADDTKGDSKSDSKSAAPKSNGFGLSWDNQGLHIGDSITLSPTMLIMIGVGVYLLQSQPVTRRPR